MLRAIRSLNQFQGETTFNQCQKYSQEIVLTIPFYFKSPMLPKFPLYTYAELCLPELVSIVQRLKFTKAEMKPSVCPKMQFDICSQFRGEAFVFSGISVGKIASNQR